MYKIIVNDIIRQCKGELLIGNSNIECIDFCTDTRKIKKGDTFIALKYVNDGHDYVLDAINDELRIIRK